MDSLISNIVTVFATVVSGTVLFLLQRFFNDHRKKEEERDQKKEKDNALVLRSIKALGNLTVANSIALRDGKTNGELKSALAEYKTVEKEMYEYLITYH